MKTLITAFLMGIVSLPLSLLGEWEKELTLFDEIPIQTQEMDNIEPLAQRVPDTTATIQLTAQIDSPNQTVQINKYFANEYRVDRGDGSPAINLTTDTSHFYATPGNYTIILTLAGGATRWIFDSNAQPLVPIAGTTANNIYVSYMPDFSLFGNSSTNVGDYFFAYFNSEWALTGLPTGSFDTKNITTVGNYFFCDFNFEGMLTNVPVGSFDIRNITTLGNGFFQGFNQNWTLTSLPDNSFNTSNITLAGGNFFSYFNRGWALTSLPTGSFNTSKITQTKPGFFTYFNTNWSLTSLPAGSFDTSKITIVEGGFFTSFNQRWSLTSLPVGSFNTSNISNSSGTVIFSFFPSFNQQWALTSLPDWSFDISKITVTEEFFFSDFNNNGALTSLPDGSFNTSNITTAGNYFFPRFNYQGALTSLPDGSFNTNNITSAKADFFEGFNFEWALTSLPDGSFDTSNITTIEYYFFSQFNQNGAITDLPSSFKRPTLDQTQTDQWGNFENSFDSPSYTLNRNAADIINGAITPSNDMNTFSDNQPGLCDIDDNRKVTPGTCTPIIDLTIPLIILQGDNPQTLKVFDNYVELWAIRSDNGLTGIVTDINTGSLNLALTGDYTVLYSYTDAANNTWTGQRIINVIERDPPLFVVDGGGNTPVWSWYSTGEYTKHVDSKIEFHIDAERKLLVDVSIDKTILTQNLDYEATGNTIITFLPTFLDTLPIKNYEAEVTFSNGFIEQGNFVIKELPPSNPSTSPNAGGWGNIMLEKDNCPNGDFSPSYYDKTCSSIPPYYEGGQGGSDNMISTEEHKATETPPNQKEQNEYQSAYTWAYQNNITTMDSLEKTRITDTITRAEMAKMIVSYLSLTHKELPQTKEKRDLVNCHLFSDLDQADTQLQPYIVQSCALNLMGYYADGNSVQSTFHPNDKITRAEVWVILSRILRANTHKGSEQQRYQNHLLALQKAGIIQQNLNPMNKETRGNVLIMLMRMEAIQ